MQNEDFSRVFGALARLSSSGNLNLGDLTTTFWCARLADRGLRSVAFDSWTSDRKRQPLSVDSVGKVLFRDESRGTGGDRNWVLETGTALVLLSLNALGEVSVVAAASSDDEAAAAMARLREVLPEAVSKGQQVTMKFWSARHGGSSRDRVLDVCRWDEIAANYTRRTRAELDALVTTTETTDAGKLVLWLGPPGTGKTYALRALAWEQRARVAVHYILDPEIFLSRVDYMMEVFVDQQDYVIEEVGKADATPKPPTRLIVLEDAGELIGADAASRIGNGLSRLLNMTDGLPGQASRTRVLITTNEDIGRLHPAITRAGRCASLIRFGALDEAEVAAWLRRHEREDLAVERPGASTLADIFARVRGKHRAAGSASVGFTEPRG